MRTGRTTLTTILALLAALTIASPATASIPQPSPELGSIGSDRAELLSFLEPIELEPDVADPPCIAERHDLFGRASALQAEGRLSLRPALDRAFDIETSLSVLPEMHVWALEQIELFPRQDESALSRALHQGYADLVGENAFAQTVLSPDPLGYLDSSNLYAFAAGDPVNGRDPTGKCESCAAGYRVASYIQSGELTNDVDELIESAKEKSVTTLRAAAKVAGNVPSLLGFMLAGNDPRVAGQLPMSRHDPSGYYFEPSSEEEARIMAAVELGLYVAPVVRGLRRGTVEVPEPVRPRVSWNPRERGYQIEDFRYAEAYRGNYERPGRGRKGNDFTEVRNIEKVELKSLDVRARSYIVEDVLDNTLLDRLVTYREKLLNVYDVDNPTPINVLEVQLLNSPRITFNQDVVFRGFVDESLRHGVIVEMYDWSTGRLLYEPPPPNP